MKVNHLITILLFVPIALMAQKNTTRTWNDSMSKSNFVIQYFGEKDSYTLKGEKYQREGEFGTLANGGAARLKQVVSQMDSAFQSKDPEKLFALGRYKYSFAEIEVNDLLVIETLKIEDLLKDETGQMPVYIMSSETLKNIRDYVASID